MYLVFLKKSNLNEISEATIVLVPTYIFFYMLYLDNNLLITM